MLKKLTRLGRLALPVILILFILLPVRANTQGISKISLKGKNITIATLFKNIKNISLLLNKFINIIFTITKIKLKKN